MTRAVGRRGGTFVAERKLEQDRTTLAGFSEQLRRHGMQPGARVLFATPRPAGPVSAAALGLQEGDPVHEVRRVRLGDGRPIVLEQSLFPAAMFPGLLQCRLDGSLYELLETRYGERPHRARESLEPVTAGVREAEALEVAEGAPLMLVERVAYDRAGQPVEFARDLFRFPLRPKELATYNTVVFDPPRAGASAQAKELAASKVPKVVAVSCNPGALARDLRILVDGGCRISRVVPGDQFLFSPHIEVVAHLER